MKHARKNPIVFGGPGALASAGGTGGIESLLQEFFHFFGKIWIRDHEIPQDPQGLSQFRIADVVTAYRAFRDSGGEVPMLQRWGTLSPSLITLVYEEELMGGHCILIRGAERKSGRLVYWDPWPLRSQLCAENNKAGVDAQLVGGDDEFFWAVDPSMLAKVLYAVFVPA